MQALVMGSRVLFGTPNVGETAVAPYASSAIAGAGRRSQNPRLEESGCIPSPWRVCVIEEWFY